MLKRSKINSAVLLAFGFVGALPSMAQEGQRVEITGSSVRRIDAESALPVQVITKEQIVLTGATSVVDLIRRLPTVQGGSGESGRRPTSRLLAQSVPW